RVLEEERILGPELAVEDALLEVVHLRLLHDAGEGLDEPTEDRRVLRCECVPVRPIEIGEDLAVAVEDRDLVFADDDVVVHPHVPMRDFTAASKAFGSAASRTVWTSPAAWPSDSSIA